MSGNATPLERGLRMPAEWAPHERTLMAWPCRESLWGQELGSAKHEYAGVANAILAFEPLTMVCRDGAAAHEATAALDARAEILVHPIDDSWLRDSGPVYVVSSSNDARERAAVHFGFNAWGGRFPPWDADARIGATLAAHTGDEVIEAPFILEGGSIAVDGRGTLVTTEQCLLNPNRNPTLDRAQIEAHVRDHLGATDVVWLDRGLRGDRDTDGHVDLIAAFAPPGLLLLQEVADGPDHEPMLENRARATSAGLEVAGFPFLVQTEVAGQPVTASYLNLYVGNGAVIVPTFEDEQDGHALLALDSAFPDHEIVGVPARTIAYGGGGPHCITQQVPAIA